jgi:hypothetical protein
MFIGIWMTTTMARMPTSEIIAATPEPINLPSSTE